MHYQESVQFYQYQHKKYIVQYQIETSSYDRFKYAFKTDKYINIIQWEYILSKINRAVVGVFRNKYKWEKKKNRFTTDNLIISYEFVDKEEGFVNYESIGYEFDWIVKVTINKTTTIVDSCSVRESQNSTVSPKKRSPSSSRESVLQNDENMIFVDDDDDEHIHENKKAKLEENDNVKSSILQQPNRYNFKFRGERSDSSKQSSITNYITNKNEKIKSKKPKKQIQSTSKDALAQINQEKLQQMNDFVARSEQEEQKMIKRKEELKDYEVLNCFDMKNDEIEKIIKNLDFELSCFFDDKSENLTSINSAKINPCDITASNILSEKQTMLVLRTIEKQHAKNGKELCDNVLHNVALPRVMIELFKNHHNLKIEEAIERIKTQEEKKILFKEQFNESY